MDEIFKICKKCGTVLTDGASVCPKCSISLQKEKKRPHKPFIVLAAVMIVFAAAVVLLVNKGGNSDFVSESVGNEEPSVSEPLQTVTESNPETPPENEWVMILGVKYNIESTTELNLNHKDINDITLRMLAPKLKQLTNLTNLYLAGNGLSDITPLSELNSLKVLFLGDNFIDDLTPLSGLTSLVSLDIHSNSIRDITPLSGLTDMLYLVLDDNYIDDLSPLSELTQLILLSLYDNQISDSDKEQLKAMLPDCEIIF